MMVKLFPIFHITAGIFLIYYVTSLFLNKSYIEINNQEIKVYNEPLPWFRGNKNFNIHDISQVYVKETKRNAKNGVKYAYELRAVMADGFDEKIFKLDSLESQDLFQLERHLESYLGITDEPVRGEYGYKPNFYKNKSLDLNQNPQVQKEKEILTRSKYKHNL